jgi:hypothetical protein
MGMCRRRARLSLARAIHHLHCDMMLVSVMVVVVVVVVVQSRSCAGGAPPARLRTIVEDPDPARAAMANVQLLYNNDGENLWAVTSPYHVGGAPINASVIRGSVRDVAGIADLNLICPFHNVPW